MMRREIDVGKYVGKSNVGGIWRVAFYMLGRYDVELLVVCQLLGLPPLRVSSTVVRSRRR